MQASRLTAALAAVALATAPAAGRAAGTQVIFQTSDVDAYQNRGDAQGSLRLTFSDGGIIQGFYRPVDGGGRLVNVHGGLDGDRIYLYIGDRPPINGTLTNGKIDAYTLEGARLHHFTGVRADLERS